MRRITHRPGAGFWVSPQRLTAAQRDELAALLPGRLGPDKVEAFLCGVAEEIDVWEKAADIHTTAGAAAQGLERLDAALRRLDHALAGLDKATLAVLRARFQALAWLTDPRDPAVPLSREMRAVKPDFSDWLNALTDDLTDLQALVDDTADKLRPSNVSLERIRARELVGGIVRVYGEVFGKRPPKSDWLYAFMAALGDTVGITLGKDIIKAVLTATK